MKENYGIKSVLKGLDEIIIRLPYDVVQDSWDTWHFADAIYSCIVSIWYYVHEREYYTIGVVNDSRYVPKVYTEPLNVPLYPSKKYMMYKDMLDYVNQYMQVQLNFMDFVGITEKSITDGMYHSETHFAYVIDLEWV